MASSPGKLGKNLSIHALPPALVQRAAIIALLSFIFFLLMMVFFSIRQNFVYFLLATAFFIVEIFTLLGLFVHRRNVLKVFENGLCYKKQCIGYEEIDSATLDDKGLTVMLIEDPNKIMKSDRIVIPNTLQHLDVAARLIEDRLQRNVSE